MEMYNLSEFTCLTCLIQLSTEEKNYVIDVLSPGVWDMVPLLAPIFADPSVVKVGQSIGSMDVPSLHRDFGIFMVNAFDTYEAARKLRLSRVGLKDICEAYGLSADRSLEYKTLKAHYQTCDWRTRPLSEDMIRYGRFDVHYLIALRKLMIRDLAQGDLWDTASEREGIDKDAEAELVSKALRAMIRRGGHDDDYGDEADFPSDMEDFNSIAASVPESEYFTSEETEDDDNGKNGNNKTEEPKITTASELRMCGSLMFVISQSQQRCLRMWKSKTEVIRVPKNHAFATIHAKQMKEAGQSNLDSFLCEKIVEWRRNVAKVAGTMPGLVCSTDLLIAIVQKRPKSHSELKRLQFFLPELLQNEESPYVESLIHTIRNFKATALHAGATKDAADAKDPDALMEPVNNDPSMEFHKVPRESHVREDMNDSNDEEHAHLRMKYLTIAVCVSAVAASIAIIMVRKRKR
jgi:ribonuclease D